MRLHGLLLLALTLPSLAAGSEQTQAAPPPVRVEYREAQAHEVKPHRRSIPTPGMRPGFNQLKLTLTVSPAGDVVDAKAGGSQEDMRLWPRVQGEVQQWRFAPFERGGHPVTASVEEYVDLVPPERLPTKHVPAPAVRPDSEVTLTLERSGCYGFCPSYSVSVSTGGGIVFDGQGYVVARGRHTAAVEAGAVRRLAKRLAEADFYSLDDRYEASVTDNRTFTLTAEIDGRRKQVIDYVGSWQGMPAVVTDLEEEVDALARSDRWLAGSEGLVEALRAERFDFKTPAAQTMLKEAAARGEAASVRELLDAGVPLKPSAPAKSETPPEAEGWLTAASSHPAVLRILVAAGASRDDQRDKDLALGAAADAGSVEAADVLMAYGADPKADFSRYTTDRPEDSAGPPEPLAGSVLISAAASGNPEMVRAILKHAPRLEARDREGKTAMFAAASYRSSDREGARVECVRLLAAAGADVNAQDQHGNTPLHETFLTDVEEALLGLGADVNARNADGETPIFTSVDDDAIPLFIQHGANLLLRNTEGKTVVEAARESGPQRQQALLRAMAAARPH